MNVGILAGYIAGAETFLLAEKEVNKYVSQV